MRLGLERPVETVVIALLCGTADEQTTTRLSLGLAPGQANGESGGRLDRSLSDLLVDGMLVSS